MYHGEKLNSISHLVGAVFALVALGALLAVSIQTQDPVVIIGFATFGFTLVLLYTMSTLYHSFQAPELKQVFKLLDHIAIYLLIAGTYTPFMLISMDNDNGSLILGLVWTLAIIGILSEVFLSGRAVKICQVIAYLGMGWACSLDFDSLRQGLPTASFYWLTAGGIAYTAGVVFYVLDKASLMIHAHGIWHFFVLLGSIFHFIAVMGSLQ